MVNHYGLPCEITIIEIQENYGIKVEAAWVNLDRNQFIWIRSFADSDEVKTKEAAFYASPEWNAVMDHARSHLARIQVEPMTSVLKIPANP